MRNNQLLASEESLPPTLSYGLEAVVLFFTGFLATAGGLAMMAAPRLSPDAMRVAERLAGVGLSSGLLVLGGLALLGMGILARMIPHVAHSAAFAARMESPGRTSLEPVVAGLDTISRHLAELGSQVAELRHQVPSQDATFATARDELVDAFAKKQSDSLFRLAASLDQLGARLERHFDERFESLTDQVARLGSEVRSLDLHVGRSEPQPAAVPLPQASVAPPPAGPYPEAPAVQEPAAAAPAAPAAVPQAQEARVALPQPPLPQDVPGAQGDTRRMKLSDAGIDGPSVETLLPDYRVREALEDNRRKPAAGI